MPTAKQRHDQRMMKQAVSTMEMLIKKIKSGKMSIESQGIWNGLYPGKYTFRINVINLDEIEDSSEESK